VYAPGEREFARVAYVLVIVVLQHLGGRRAIIFVEADQRLRKQLVKPQESFFVGHTLTSDT
jgi:hypothetical protein